MEMKSSQETDDYRYFDPKLLRATDSSSIPRNRQPFQEVVLREGIWDQGSVFLGVVSSELFLFRPWFFWLVAEITLSIRIFKTM